LLRLEQKTCPSGQTLIVSPEESSGKIESTLKPVHEAFSVITCESEAEKELYYDAISSAAAGCRPSNAVSHLDSKQIAEETADVVSRVAKRRQRSAQYSRDRQEKLITDAYATTAIAYRRAAGTYIDDEKMLTFSHWQHLA
jgi:hypothetical protein